MSVILDTPYFRRAFAGYELPALPEGFWTASSSVTGDATGGIRQVRVKFQEADQGQSGNMFSLEQLSITIDNETGRPFIISTVNMDRMGNLVGLYSTVGSLASGAASIVGAAIVNTSAIGTRASWLGAPFEAGEALVTFATDNADGELFSVFAQGYIWGPRSVLAAGGPQRPAGGMYSN